jgi:ABC-type microcin C transport system permease subunit YejE
MHFTLDVVMEKISTWLTTGEFDSAILSEDFQFFSPFYKQKNKTLFLEDFKSKTFYKDSVLSNIVKFEPVILFKSVDENYFSIILQYHTKNGQSVWETVLGKVDEAGLLVELRSIYDLAATKDALQL